MSSTFKRLTSWLSKSKRIEQVNIQTDSGSLTDLDFLSKKKRLVLDLDETLFHAQTYKESSHKHSVKFDYRGKDMQYYVAARPGLIEFLEEMQKYYVLTVYTCSDISYAEAILTKIGAKSYFNQIFSRVNCKKNQEQILSKDLKVIGVDFSDIVFIDDLERHIQENSQNGLKIAAYHGGKKDKELKTLSKFLKKLAFVPDVRSVQDKYQLFIQGKPLVSENDLVMMKESSEKLEVDVSGEKHSTDVSQEDESDEENVVEEQCPIEEAPHFVLKANYPKVFLQVEAVQA